MSYVFTQLCEMVEGHGAGTGPEDCATDANGHFTEQMQMDILRGELQL